MGMCFDQPDGRTGGRDDRYGRVRKDDRMDRRSVEQTSEWTDIRACLFRLSDLSDFAFAQIS